MSREELVRSRSEFTDENSVIFSMSDIGGSTHVSPEPTEDSGAGTFPSALPRGVQQRPPEPAPPAPEPRRRSSPRNLQVATQQIELEDAGDERTTITEPPGFDVGEATRPDLANPPADPSEALELDTGDLALSEEEEPETLSNAPPVRGQGPAARPTAPAARPTAPAARPTAPARAGRTTAAPAPPRGKAAPAADDADPTRIDFSPGDDAAPADTAGGAALSAAVTSPRARRASAPPAPALSARNPVPAISEIRPPRTSRRTPVSGVPAAPLAGASTSAPVRHQGGRSILSEIVRDGAAEASIEPVASVPGFEDGPTTSDGVPRNLLSTGSAPPPSTVDTVRVRPAGSPTPTARVRPEPRPDGLPLAAPIETPNPLRPLPSRFPLDTGALARLEVDEIPSAYRVGRSTEVTRWMWRGLLGLILVVGGVLIGVVAFEDRTPPARATLEIVSIPAGASVRVDGKPLAGVTPMTVPDVEPGGTYAIEVGLARYQPFSTKETIPAAGGSRKVVAPLKPVVVTLRITSTPPGAQVILDGRPMGFTPLVLQRLDPFLATTIELHHKEYRTERRTLDWGDRTEQALDFVLER
jgi:hypothetical protein